MVARPLFQRSLRYVAALPQGEVEIAAPPAAPAAPTMSLLTIVWSVIPGVLGALLMYLLNRSRGGSSLSYIGYSLPMMAITYVAQLGNYVYQKRKHAAAVAALQAKYRAFLQERRQELQRTLDAQHRLMGQLDPAPPECLALVEQLDPRLWQRSPEMADFLRVRVGLGAAPFALQVKPPRPDRLLDPDPLYQAAQELAADFTQVEGVPVQVPLRAAVTGLVGPRGEIVDAARGMTVQVATHHAPDEVKIVAVFPAAEADEWSWMRWLPHVWGDDRQIRFLAADEAGARALLSDYLLQVLQRRKLLAEGQKDGPLEAPVFVIFLADRHVLELGPVVAMLLREGPRIGAYPVILAERRQDLPPECTGFVEVGRAAQVVQTQPVAAPTTYTPDAVSSQMAEAMARSLAPIQLQSMGRVAELPTMVPLLDLLAVKRVEELAVAARWQSASPEQTLQVPVGLLPGGKPLLFDLHQRGHGPHGLVAGATGWGKSELLQSLIAALAVSYHPHDLAFVMVDFKGEGMAALFQALPHLVGVISNLEGSLARRAQLALAAELERRQKLFKAAGVNNISDYMRRRRQGPAPAAELTPLPYLVIVVDEFAELAARNPDFTRELLASVVRVGRSLGVHLILATQKPAGVVSEQIWGNTRFRFCLRVERPEDSQEVLKRPDAAGIAVRGRAYFQLGNNEEFVLFQTAWSGAEYNPDAAAAQTRAGMVAEVGLDGTRYPLTPQGPAQGLGSGPTQLQAVIDHVAAVAVQGGIARVQGPWLPPLPPQVALATLQDAAVGWDGQEWRPGATWMDPVIGVVDNPEQQSQGPLALNLGRDGHLIVYGAPGMGKTTFVETLVTALAHLHSPAELHAYLVGCSGLSLTSFRALPHVGDVVLGEETEKVSRLLRYLLRELEGRKGRLAAAGVKTLAEYRAACPAAPLPAILVVFDDYHALAENNPDAEEAVVKLAAEGGNLGLHLVFTVNSPAQIRPRLRSTVSLAVCLYLADRSHYGDAIGNTRGLEPAELRGRALLKGTPPLELQIALPMDGENERARSLALRQRMAAMDQAWSGPRARPIDVLPEQVHAGDLARYGDIASAVGGRVWAVPVGLEVEGLKPFSLDLAEGPHFLVTGPAESGKTTLLNTWVRGLSARPSPAPAEIWLVDMGAGGLSALRELAQVSGYVTDGEMLTAALEQVEQEVARRRELADSARRSGDAIPQFPALVVFLDDYGAFRDGDRTGVKERLEQLVRRDRGLGLHLILVASTADLSANGYDGLIRAMKEQVCGLLLGSSDHGELQTFNLRLPPGEAGKRLPAGLGFVVRRDRYRKIKVALP